MKRLFKVALIAILALAAVSCAPSVVGEWEYISTEYYEDGELVEADYYDEDWGFVFKEDGTGYEIDEGDRVYIYWELEDDLFYYDYSPIYDINADDILEVKKLTSSELQLVWYDNYGDAEVYTFKKVK